jgi:squalene synthase HpnC
MTASAQFRSGKGTSNENFPVASWLIAARHRPAILAFYNFVRTADDIADHPGMGPDEKLNRLDRLEQSLIGSSDIEPEGVILREALERRGVTTRHAQDLLRAFRQDVTKSRYASWDELIDYCAYSAMPVGRFVLDVHGESRDTWPASDALCAALQIINHLQDCAEDYKNIDRVYLPLDALSERGVTVDALSEPRASPALRGVLHALAARTAQLVDRGRSLPVGIADTRLALEIAVIQRLAARLLVLLQSRDPLSEQVHFGKVEKLSIATNAITRTLVRRFLGASPQAQRYQTP